MSKNLIEFVAFCDLGEDSGGSCIDLRLAKKPQILRHEPALCNGCGQWRYCAVVRFEDLEPREDYIIETPKSEERTHKYLLRQRRPRHMRPRRK